MLRGERGFVFTLCMGKNSAGVPSWSKLDTSSYVRLSAQPAQILALCTLLSRWTEGYTCMTCLSQKQMQKSARVTTSSRECAVDWVMSPGRLQTAWAAWHCVFGWYVQRWHMLTPQSKMIQWASEAATNEAWLIQSEMCFQLLHNNTCGLDIFSAMTCQLAQSQ